jgi:hypothetical protein
MRCLISFVLAAFVVGTIIIQNEPAFALLDGPYPPPTTTSGPSNPNWGNGIYIPIIIKEYPPHPVESLSYYIQTLSNIYDLGCSAGSSAASNPEPSNVFLFLDYGKPYRDINMVLGTKIYSQAFVSIDQISASVVSFALGFYQCTTNDTVKIAVGTNSSGGTVTDLIANSHGVAWANLIIGINNQLQNSYPYVLNRVEVVGGNNIEPDFNPTYVPLHWLQGYNSVANRKSLYVIASAAGCSETYPPDEPESGYRSPGSCNNGWTQDDIYYVSWGAPSSLPFPEIFDPQNANANQWYRIGLYTKLSHNTTMWFRGSMTEFAACQQQQPCAGDNSPSTGFAQLYTRIDNDPHRRIGNNMTWATDMKYGPQ